jgi:hypothetical protein
MDDRTTAYVLAAQPPFEDLRQVAAQLAGLLVLAATGSKDSTPDHPMLQMSKQVLASAEDGVKRAGVLVGEHARAHYRSLADASVSLHDALTRAGAWPMDIDAVLVPLQHAYAHLRDASRTLPGFAVIEMSQGCACLAVASAKAGPDQVR